MRDAAAEAPPRTTSAGEIQGLRPQFSRSPCPRAGAAVRRAAPTGETRRERSFANVLQRSPLPTAAMARRRNARQAARQEGARPSARTDAGGKRSFPPPRWTDAEASTAGTQFCSRFASMVGSVAGVELRAVTLVTGSRGGLRENRSRRASVPIKIGDKPEGSFADPMGLLTD